MQSPPTPPPDTPPPPFSYTITPLKPTEYTAAFTLADTCFASLDTLLFKETAYPPSPTSSAQRTTSRIARLANSTPRPTLFKVTDTATGEIIGVAHWTIHTDDEEVTQSVADAVADIVDASIPEMNRDAVRGFYTMVTEGKRDVLRVDVPVCGVYGRRGPGYPVVKMTRRVELDTVFVHPDYRRRGVATRLLEWGIEQAERLGLLVYLEATEEGRRVYERVGFEVVRVERFDAAWFWGAGRCEYTFMVRMPTGIMVN
ncbi:acyl-CoA N-acyltransferase [Aspergillus carlsbadensis]|nr:acyl-CoA N-acyltransferase [Aspergillus carlsbadensis]